MEAAKEDAQQLEEAAKVSLERLQEVHARMTCVLLASVAKHGSGWRVRVTVGAERVCGPTRSLQAQAEEDCSWLRGLQHMSTAELRNAVARLHQQVAEAGAARDREARFKEVVLAEMRNCLAMPQPGKRPRRARNVDSESDYSFALASVQLLVSAYEEVKAMSESGAGQLLLERNDMLDQLSRPLGTAGFSEPVLHTGLKNLRNSCWLNSVLQCFYFCGPLQHAFTEDSMVGSMVNDVLVQLGNKK